MKKYNIETVYNYINGEDITDFTLEELESNTNFMIDVINVSNDKNFYNFTEDNVKTDYRFVKFIINKFKEDENLITVVADTYIENQDNEQNYIELLIIMCNLIKDKNSKNYKKYKFLLEVNHKSKRLQIELGKLKMNTEAADNLGMGFLIIYDSFNSSQIILDYYAKAIIEDIFEEYDIVLEDYLHQRFNTFEKIEKIGIKKYILDFIAVYDEMLSSYLSSHIYLLEDISKQLDKIKNNWNKYIETKERKKYNEIIKAKYISFAIFFAFGVIMGSVTAISVFVTSGFSNMQSVLYGYEFGLTLATTTAGIMYPLMLKIGTDKNELIMILSAIASIGLLVLVSAILTPLTGEMNMKHSLVGAISTMIALGIFIGSYFISIKIYQNKEFA